MTRWDPAVFQLTVSWDAPHELRGLMVVTDEDVVTVLSVPERP